jgi:pimeloyl-ACP methyl ester carboxylesterase
MPDGAASRYATVNGVRLHYVIAGSGDPVLLLHGWPETGYDRESYRDRVRALQITPHIARRGTEHGSGLGVYRWVVEGTIALLHWFRRLRIRWEIRDDIHQVFVTLGFAIICWRRLRPELCQESLPA